jgi:hypothetical protein
MQVAVSFATQGRYRPRSFPRKRESSPDDSTFAKVFAFAGMTDVS